MSGLFTAVNTAFGQDWTPTASPSTNWISLASSADGTKLVAAVAGGGGSWPGPIYTSTNSGATWMQTSAPTNYWRSIASSADGNKLVAMGSHLIANSTNSGAVWTARSAPEGVWDFVASSADGAKLIAASHTIQCHYNPFSGYYECREWPGPMYVSADFGATWTKTSAPDELWSNVASSADGTKLVAVSSDYGGGPLVTSTNSGATWVTNNMTHNYWASAACSTDGTKMFAAGGGDLYTSDNSGATWTKTIAPFGGWGYVSCSADGNKLVGTAWTGSFPPNYTNLICTSTNSGATWAVASGPGDNWVAVVSSADGSKLAAAASGYNGGIIYTSQTTPTPLLSLTPSGGNALLSWTIPSMNFTLQQNSDLTTTNWTDVPTPRS